MILMDQVSSRPKLSPVLIVIAAGVVLLVGGYLLLRNMQRTPEEKAAEVVDKSMEAATLGTVPTINPQSNPLEKLPELNPIEKTNPFKDIRTNPFE